MATNSLELKPGRTILIKANVLFEGETLRITAKGISHLDQPHNEVFKRLKIYVDKQDPLPSLKTVLSREGEGKGQVILVSRINPDLEVEVRLPDTYNVTSLLAKAVKSIPGIIDVREV